MLQNFNPTQDGPFQGCLRIGGGGQKSPLFKISHIYPTMKKLDNSYALPKENPKNI